MEKRGPEIDMQQETLWKVILLGKCHIIHVNILYIVNTL